MSSESVADHSVPDSHPLVIGLLGRTVVTCNNRVAVTGLKGAGKDTAALYLADELKQRGYDVHVLRLASPLKETICEVYGLDMAELENDRFKKEQDCISGMHGQTFSYRQLLEYFGTDVIRAVLGPDHWLDQLLAKISIMIRSPVERLVIGLAGSRNITLLEARAMAERMKELKLVPLTSKPVAVIVPDVRFYNEYLALKHVAGAQTVSILVERCMGQVSEEQLHHVHSVLSKDNHVSNTWDDRIEPGIVIRNSGTLGEFKQQITDLVEDIIESVSNQQKK